MFFILIYFLFLTKEILKRITSLLSSALLIAAMLTGCSSAGTPSTPPESSLPSPTASPVAPFSDASPIKIATTGSHAFFSQTNAKGELEGFEIDVWAEIAKRLNREIEWYEADFPGMMGLLESGKVDTAADQIGITEERKELYDFTDVYFYVPYRIIVAGSNDSIESVEDLYGKKLGLTVAEVAHEYIAALDPDGKIEIVDYEDSSVVPNDVATGRLDASVMSALHIETVKSESGLDIKGVGDPLYSEENGYPFHKTEEGRALRDQVNAVLSDLREEGFLHDTAIKWFGFDPMEVK